MSDTQEAVDRGDTYTPNTAPPEAKAAEPAPEPVKEEPAKEEPVVEAEAKAEEPEVKAEEPEETPRDTKGKFIPKDRFDEAVRKERSEKEEYARRLKEFEEKEAQRVVSADFAEAQKQVKEMIKQHTSLLADGELEKAADLMEKILEMKENMAEAKAESKAMAAKNAAKEEVRYDALVAKLEADYPMINPDAEEFDRVMVKRVQAYMTGLMQTERLSPSQALKQAVDDLLGQPKKDDPAPAAAKAEELGVRRKEEAVKKAMDAKTKQPASTNGVGIDHDKEGGALDASAVMKMSWDEFVKLPDAKLAELRGDFVS